MRPTDSRSPYNASEAHHAHRHVRTAADSRRWPNASACVAAQVRQCAGRAGRLLEDIAELPGFGDTIARAVHVALGVPVPELPTPTAPDGGTDGPATDEPRGAHASDSSIDAMTDPAADAADDTLPD
jgi:hypothetical protein